MNLIRSDNVWRIVFTVVWNFVSRSERSTRQGQVAWSHEIGAYVACWFSAQWAKTREKSSFCQEFKVRLGGCTKNVDFSLWGKQCIVSWKWTFPCVLAHCALLWLLSGPSPWQQQQSKERAQATFSSVFKAI